IAHAAVELGAAAPGAVCPALPKAAHCRIRADAGGHGGDPDPTVSDHSADGRYPDPVSGREGNPALAGHGLSGGVAGLGLAGLGAELGTYLHTVAGVREDRC